MKLFSWMQNKLIGKAKVCKNTNAAPTTHHVKQDSREEFSDWPHGLLAIGTFGNNDLKQSNEIRDEEENQERQIEEVPSSSDHDLQDFTPEEIGKLQKELTKLLTKKPTKEKEKEIAKLPLDRFLNCPSSLEVDRRISSNTGISDLDEKEDDIERTISVILGKCKDICENNKKKDIGKKSLSFLLKKMLVCRSGFAPQPSLRDTFQESRMENLLRTLLLKKMNPQSCSRSRASSMKKYIEDTNKDQQDEPKRNKTSHASKWVKTDSEYIVLEI